MLRGITFCILALLAGCGGPTREPFTLAEQRMAEVPGIPDARVWGDATPASLRLLGMLPEQVGEQRPGHLDHLALSSGGPAGAYGAGLLVGWTEAGNRPEFDVVTGVSSGALLAPFAFVGPETDAAVRELWAGGLAQDLGRGLNFAGLLTGQGVVNPAPLRDLLNTFVDDDLVAAIAREHQKGRRLLVVTTNLDAQLPVIWNLGAIAASGQIGSADLVREVLLASASVPVAFPPVLIVTRAGSRAIQEMHVDGGVSSQIFALPDAALADASFFSVPAGRDATLWLVASHVLGPEYNFTPGGTFSVGPRAYGTLIKSDIRSELFAVVDAAEEAGFNVRLASLQGTVPWSARDPFAPSFMQQMFELGRESALAGVAFP